MVKLKIPTLFFFTCTQYSALRNDIFNEIFRIKNANIVNTHVLLWGDCSICITDNKHLFSLVHRYIYTFIAEDIHLIAYVQYNIEEKKIMRYVAWCWILQVSQKMILT